MIESLKGVGGVGSLFSEGPLSGTGPTAAQGTGTQVSFASLLGDMASDMAAAVRQSEAKSFEAIQGKASTREVVDAVMQAEQALQTAVAIRDKVVTAYLEVARMQI